MPKKFIWNVLSHLITYQKLKILNQDSLILSKYSLWLLPIYWLKLFCSFIFCSLKYNFAIRKSSVITNDRKVLVGLVFLFLGVYSWINIFHGLVQVFPKIRDSIEVYLRPNSLHIWYLLILVSIVMWTPFSLYLFRVESWYL